MHTGGCARSDDSACSNGCASGNTLEEALLHPPDVGSEGKEVIEEEDEVHSTVGLVIRRDQFPDKLFAPPKRSGLLPEDPRVPEQFEAQLS